jgi:hypothetical protein
MEKQSGWNVKTGATVEKLMEGFGDLHRARHDGRERKR